MYFLVLMYVLLSRCVHSCMLHKMWPMKKENELTLRWAEMRMIPWMCGVKATDSNELTTQLNTKKRMQAQCVSISVSKM